MVLGKVTFFIICARVVPLGVNTISMVILAGTGVKTWLCFGGLALTPGPLGTGVVVNCLYSAAVILPSARNLSACSLPAVLLSSPSTFCTADVTVTNGTDGGPDAPPVLAALYSAIKTPLAYTLTASYTGSTRPLVPNRRPVIAVNGCVCETGGNGPVDVFDAEVDGFIVGVAI
jgi:hypothetical protein